MTMVRTLTRNAAIGVALADAAHGLNAFLKPGCSAAIWRRQTPRDLTRWLQDLDPDLLPRGRVILRPQDLAATLSQIFEIHCTPAGPERDTFHTDVTAIAEMFAQLMKAQALRLRLDVVTTNACRKFHIDAVTARLVCTYRGTGTQYGISTDGEDPRRVFTVPTGAPILLRGTLWPNPPASGLLHRSPPIEGSGETRLLLVLDPVQEFGEAGAPHHTDRGSYLH